jgi:hypothetical protein
MCPGVVVMVAMTACAGLRAHGARHSPPSDCVRHVASAQAALATPESTPGAPVAHVHAIAMHDYHTCVANSSESR